MDKTMLKNGAKIDSIVKCKDVGYVVLAVLKRKSGVEYVTWITDDELNCFHGNYFITDKYAREDFLKRVTQYC